jgi:predicted nucleic acid-binding protein
MVAFVVDNSVAIAWVYPKQSTEYTEKLLDSASHGLLHTAFIWPAEFANAANVLVNRGLLTEALGAEMISLSQDFGFIVDNVPAPAELYSVSRKYGLTAYDAAYLELSIRLNLPLATRDTELTKAAKNLNLYLEP